MYTVNDSSINPVLDGCVHPLSWCPLPGLHSELNLVQSWYRCKLETALVTLAMPHAVHTLPSTAAPASDPALPMLATHSHRAPSVSPHALPGAPPTHSALLQRPAQHRWPVLSTCTSGRSCARAYHEEMCPPLRTRAQTTRRTHPLSEMVSLVQLSEAARHPTDMLLATLSPPAHTSQTSMDRGRSVRRLLRPNLRCSEHSRGPLFSGLGAVAGCHCLIALT